MIKLAKRPSQGKAADGGYLESEIKRDILSALARVDGIRMTVNACGFAINETGNKVHYGLGTGSADLVGIATSTIFLPSASGLVQRRFGRVIGIEVKKPGGSTHARQRRLQDAWIATVRRLGGIAGYAYSVEEGLALVADEGFDVSAARDWWVRISERRER